VDEQFSPRRARDGSSAASATSSTLPPTLRWCACLAPSRLPPHVQAKFGVATWNKAQRVFTDNPVNHGPTDRLPPYTAPVRVG